MKLKLLYSIPLFSLLFINFTHAQQTYVPDDLFEQYLIDEGHDNVLDNFVTTSSINTITSVDINGINVTDLTGLEDFTALTTLDVSGTLIVNLNVIGNTALTYLDANDTAISSVDLSNNLLLDILYIDNTSLTSIDLTANTALTTLSVSNTNLTTLDVSNNAILSDLSISETFITSLDVSNNAELTFLTVFNTDINTLDVSNNPILTTLKSKSTSKLFCITVADETAANAETGIYTAWEKDEDCSYSEFCSLTDVPDDAFEQFLISEGYDSGPLDDVVPTSNIVNITSLDLNTTNVVDLTGIEDFTALTDLVLSYSTIENLDLSANSTLASLTLTGTPINFLDVSANTNLTMLNTVNTPNLDCVQVTDEDAAIAGTGIYANWVTDENTAYSEDCDSYLSNPDFNMIEAFVGPNPIKDELNIVLKNNATLTDVSLYDISGKVILKSTSNNISTSQITSGMYLVKVTTDKGSFTRKLIKS